MAATDLSYSNKILLLIEKTFPKITELFDFNEIFSVQFNYFIKEHDDVF